VNGRQDGDALAAERPLASRRPFGHLALIAKESTLLAGLRMLGMLASLLLTVLLARALSPADFGAVSIAFSVALIGSRLVTFNVDAAALRFVTRCQANGDRSGIAAYVALGRRLLLFSSAALAGGMVAGWAGSMLWPGSALLPLHVAAGAAAAPLCAWIRLSSATVAALGHVLLGATPEHLVRPLLMLLLTGAVWLSRPDLDVLTVLALYIASAACVCVIMVPLFRGAMAGVPANARRCAAAERKRWIGAGLDLLIPTLFLELSVNTIILLSSFVLSADQVATLTIVLRIQAVVLFGVTSINMVVAPRIAQSLGNGDEKTVDSLLLTAAHLKLWPALILAGLLAAFGEDLLAIFGPEYESALLPLITLCTIPIIMAVFGPVVLFVTVLELEHAANRVFQLASVALATLVPLLGHYFGVQGAAIAVVVVWLAWHVALYRLIRVSTRYSTLRLTPRQA
jgi:O-antigen/teichoic acid export membrane protein